MTVARYDIYQVKCGATVLSGITESDLQVNPDIRGEAAGGAVVPSVVSLVGQHPGASFSTLNVGGCYDITGQQGASVNSMSGGLIMYAHKHLDGGTRAGASLHKTFTMNRGVLVPGRITCEHRGDAVMSAAALFGWDGTNNPIVPAELASLATPAADAGRWTLGKVVVGGVTLTGLKGITVDFGVQMASEGADSEIWDRVTSVLGVRPSISLRGIDPDWFKATGAIPMLGKAAAHADTTIYLKKRAAGGTFVLDATAEHILITAAGAASIQQAFGGSHGGPGETSLVIGCYHDGTNDPMVFDTTAAIV